VANTKAYDGDSSWLATLDSKDAMRYFEERLKLAKAQADYDDAVGKAQATYNKPAEELASKQAAHKKALEEREQAKTDLAPLKVAIQTALDAVKPEEADDPKKAADQLANLQRAVDAYFKTGVGAVAAKTAAVAAADTAARKVAEPKPEAAVKDLQLDPEASKIAARTLDLAKATAEDPLADATKAFEAFRSDLKAKPSKEKKE
jgi:hypothetical protein